MVPGVLLSSMLTIFSAAIALDPSSDLVCILGALSGCIGG